MTKIHTALLRASMLAAILAAICCISLTAKAAPDEGKNLTRAPGPLVTGAQGECNRECLYMFVDRFFNAMLSRCPCNVAFATGAKYTENELEVKVGEGMWKTFSGRGTYRVYLADPSTGTVGYFGDITEDNGLLEGMVALRLKVKDHLVTEAEIINVREQKRPKGGLGLNTAGVMTPRMLDELSPEGLISPDAALLAPVRKAESRDELLGAAKSYFDAYAQDRSSLAHLDAQCLRRENGMAATGNAEGPVVDPAQPSFRIFSQNCGGEIDRGFSSALWKFRDERPIVVDEKQGLVLVVSFFDNEGDVKTVNVSGVGNVTVPAEFLRPITFLAPQLFKIQDGNIREIESLAWPVPFGMMSDWSK